MARYLVLGRMNPATLRLTDPLDYLKSAEKMWAAIYESINKGLVEEFCEFLDSTTGYTICERKATDISKAASMFLPIYDFEVHKVILYEKIRDR